MSEWYIGTSGGTVKRVHRKQRCSGVWLHNYLALTNDPNVDDTPESVIRHLAKTPGAIGWHDGCGSCARDLKALLLSINEGVTA